MSEHVEKLQERILHHLDNVDELNTLDLAKELNEDHQKIVGAINSLQFIGNLVEPTLMSSTTLELTDEGKAMAKNGSYEANLYNAIPIDGNINQVDLMKLANAKIGFSQAMSAKWILLDKSGGGPPVVKRQVPEIVDTVQIHLQNVEKGDLALLNDKVKQQLNSRKLIKNVVIKSFLLKKGPEFTTTIDKMETDLTTEMLASGSWEKAKFKDYNFKALGSIPESGFLHPLLKVRSEMRQIFLEMGFSEMPTSRYVESSFWNFDALFQPQQHPARDAHDTFFVTKLMSSNNFPMDYLERVKTVHSVGGYGSIGYGYDWKIEEAQKNLLRTHTTAISARILYELAQQKEFKPTRLFSIDRVFRNETLDATHLAEFFQVEGVIADYGLTLGDLIGTFTEFFKKLGITQLEFKPAYNPYTEPSMEIFCYHPGLGRWIEIGNSGMFRPEMLLPMGLPEGVRVLAWGLSLERPTMIKYGYDNIRDLVGPRVDLRMVQSTPLCRLDK